MKLHIKTLFFVIILLLSGQSFANSFVIWTALKNGNSFSTNYDVENYICALHLSDETRIKLFKKAGNNFNEYEQLRRKWAQQRFKSGLKQMAYVSAVQRHATSSYARETNAFKVKERRYTKRLQEIETRTLKKWLDQGLGIVKARVEFANSLIAIGYPHQQNQDPTDLYFKWYELQKKRLKEMIRLEEVQKYEYQMALGYQREFYVRPVEIFDFAKEMHRKIEDQIEGKRLTPSELAQIVTEDERISVIAKSIELLGPSTLSLAQLHQKAPAVYSEFATKLKENDLHVEQVTKYYQAAIQLADSLEKSEIEQKIAEARSNFLLTNNDYTELMKAKIYQLAASLKVDQKLDLTALARYRSEALGKVREALEKSLSRPSTIEARIEDHIISEITHLRDHYKGLNEAGLQAITLTNWFLKFQIKKIGLSIKPQAAVEFFDKETWQGQARIEKFLKNEQYKDGLAKFRRTKLNLIGEYIDLKPESDTFLDGRRAWNYILEQF